MTESEFRAVCQHFGHDYDVHKRYYRMHDTTVELTKVGKVLEKDFASIKWSNWRNFEKSKGEAQEKKWVLTVPKLWIPVQHELLREWFKSPHRSTDPWKHRQRLSQSSSSTLNRSYNVGDGNALGFMNCSFCNQFSLDNNHLLKSTDLWAKKYKLTARYSIEYQFHKSLRYLEMWKYFPFVIIAGIEYQ